MSVNLDNLLPYHNTKNDYKKNHYIRMPRDAEIDTIRLGR